MAMLASAKRIVVGGVRIDVLSRQEWADSIIAHCKARDGASRRPRIIFAANGQVLALHAFDPEFRALFQHADAVTADGQPLVWASRLTRLPLPERTATTDLFHDIARAAEKAQVSFFLLGATDISNANAESRIRAQYPGLTIAGHRNGFFSADEEREMVAMINLAKPDVLWVGLGARKQAEFVVRTIASLQDVGCVITCGGLFDYFMPGIRRAPLWMQDLSLEWLFRAWQEPRKYVWRYFITNPLAVFLLLTRTRSE